MNKQARDQIYEAYKDELKEIDADLKEGKITQTEYNNFRRNLDHNLEQDLQDL